MTIKINPDLLVDFDSTDAYHAADLGLEPGEWDFVTCYGDLKIYEDIGARAFDAAHPPIELLGKQYKPNDLIRRII